MYGAVGSSGTYNSAFGANALNSYTTGNNNTAIGYGAGQSTTTGGSNFFGGYGAGYTNSIATNNVFLGYQAGFSVTSGSNNVAVGYQALFNSNGNGTNGRTNTAVGTAALYSATTALNNVAVGWNAGYSYLSADSTTSVGIYSAYYQTGDDNVAIGRMALNGTSGLSTATRNTSIGSYSGYSVTTGGSNFFGGYQAGYSNSVATNGTFLGYQAGYANTSGSYNTFVGNSSGYNNTTAVGNTFFGHQSGYANTTGASLTYVGSNAGIYQTGNYNTSVGAASLFGVGSQSTAANNTAIGYYAGYSVTTGGNNLFAGYQAGYAVSVAQANVLLGYSAASTLTSGSNNVVVGYGAGGLLTTGANNTFLGYGAGNTTTTGQNNVYIGINAVGSAATNTNEIVIGYSATGIGTSTTTIGTSTTTKTVIPAGVVGFGTTQPSTYGALYTAGTQGDIFVQQVGNGGYLRLAGNSAEGFIAANQYYDTASSTVKAATTGYSPQLEMMISDGSFRFSTSTSVATGNNISTTERLRIDASGNVGIGTSTVREVLQVVGNIKVGTTTSDSYIAFGDETVSGRYNGLYRPASSNTMTLGAYSYMTFNVSATALGSQTERMRIDSSGNVGIGTNTYSARLHVSGSSTVGSTTMLVKGGAPSQTGPILEAQSNLGSTILIVSGSGRVGIGTISPQSTFHVFNGASAGNYASLYIGYNTSDNYYDGNNHYYRDGSGNSRGRIDSSGNFTPGSDNSQNLGSAALRWANVYATNVTASGSLGPSYTTSTTSSTTAIFDTISVSTSGAVYELMIIGNPNSNGDANYRDIIYGKIIIGTGYSGSAVRNYIQFVCESPNPRTLYGSGGGPLTADVVYYQSGAEYTDIAQGGTATIRVKISGYVSGYTGNNTTVRLKQLA